MLCAVSGGADSVCLLHLLRERAGRGEFSLAAAHYDHRLRGEDSTADAQFVENLCKMWTIPLCLGSGDVAGEARRRGKGVEETARAMRYAFLEEAATSSGLSSVDELLSTLKEQGYDEEQLRSDARKQLLLDQSIEKMDLPQPTEEELKELYDSSVTAQDEASGDGDGDGTEGSESEAKEGEEAPETPSFEELKPQLEQQLTSQKQNEALAQKIEELKKDADVQIKL